MPAALKWAELNMPNDVTIYALSDPRKPSMIRYIGKTVKSLRARLRLHIAARHRYKTHKTLWLNSLLRCGLEPKIWPLEICSQANWAERERYWIWLFQKIPGFLNVTPGGDVCPDTTGQKQSEETIRKRADALRGRKHSPERIDKQRRALLESPKFWAACAARRGVKRSAEYLRKFKEARATSKKWIETHRKPVICITTGKQFGSISEAASSVSSSIHGLSRAMRRNWKFHGMEWRRL